MQKKEWFSNWFDTPFYHILYKNRDEEEAEHFLSNLVAFLQPKKKSKFLDLACGKGRHSIYLNSLGFDVAGCDLSKSSIEHAQESETEGLHFFVHDMRISTGMQFDFVLNLFTSIGFFEDSNDNQAMFDAVYTDLKPGGIFVIDFLNEQKVRNSLKTNEIKSIEGIQFNLDKKIENNFVVKTISFEHENQFYSFFEKVELISLEDFTKFGENSGFKRMHAFGNYQLDAYTKNSDRLLMVFHKA